MKIVILMEDTKGEQEVSAEHGLSLYIETGHHKILADTGASDRTWENAGVLGVDLTDVDTVFLSHGHYDHTGGVLTFARSHPKARIYMQKTAAGTYYHGKRYIGIDREILELAGLHLLEGNFRIDSELEIFSGIQGRRYWPKSNEALSELVGGRQMQDSFQHEQCLVIREGEETVLISGCAHNGILNILDRFEQLYHTCPSKVISGFHMAKKSAYTEEEIQIIRDTAKQLCHYPARFYTGHCTGQEAFARMKEIMGDQLVAIHAGDRIESLCRFKIRIR